MAGRTGLSGRVVVLGSANVDATALVHRLPSPGETVLAHGFHTAAGGKGLNQATAAARQGAAVSLIASLGDDDGGRGLLALMREEGIDTEHVLSHRSLGTGVAHIVVDDEGGN